MNRNVLVFFCLVIFLFGCVAQRPQVVIKDYNNASELSKQEFEAVWPNPQIHGTPTMKNPHVVIFKARDDDIQREISMNDGTPLVVKPGGVSANQYLPTGIHKVVVKRWRDIPPFGKEELDDQIFLIRIRKDGHRAQIITLR
ncbi:hypothetical protein ACFLZC_01335 [Patescibacteria group bacterium]